MNIAFNLAIALVILCSSSAMGPKSAFSQTKVALHATQAEVEIWKNRAINGPYKDGWTTIKSRADAFVSNPEGRWQGKTTNSCYNESTDGEISRTRDRGLMSSAFLYLVTKNTQYREAVRTALLAQTVEAGTDFTNLSRWCVPNSGGAGIANWVRRLVYSYSYIRDGLSIQDKSKLDSWFLAAGNFFDAVVHEPIRLRFPNRLKDDYSSCNSSSACPGSDEGQLYFGGPTKNGFHGAWVNKPAARNALVAAVAVVVNDITLKAHAKRFVQEWLKYAVWPNGVVVDQNRWNGATPQAGYLYAGTAIGSIITAVDHLARDGDTSLYDFTTTIGMFGTEGGPKSLLKVLKHYAGLTNGTIRQYASTVATSNPDLLIDQLGTKHYISYVYLAPANLYYKDSFLTQAYNQPIPASYGTGGYDPQGGDWGTYPHILFMFGQQENAVWPYANSTTPTTSPTAPSGLVVAPSS